MKKIFTVLLMLGFINVSQAAPTNANGGGQGNALSNIIIDASKILKIN